MRTCLSSTSYKINVHKCLYQIAVSCNTVCQASPFLHCKYHLRKPQIQPYQILIQHIAMEGLLCVVGGDGYIGSFLVRLLLSRGYHVNATIFPRTTPEVEEGPAYLLDLPGARERLKLFDADLRDEGSFDEPVFGCEGVFLVASPLIYGPKDPENELMEVAVNGTINVLKSCLKTKTVKRVVFTSSSCTLSPLDEHGRMNTTSGLAAESFWSPIDYFRNNINMFPIWPYFVSKILAEKAAMDFGRENNIQVISINPSVVGGAFITPYKPSSVEVLFSILAGNERHFSTTVRSIVSAFGGFPVVHVSDVCNAHLFLMEHPAPQGRYLCSAHTLSMQELASFLMNRYPEFKITDRLHDVDSPSPPPLEYKSQKLMDLGFSYKHGLQDIYADSINCCEKLNMPI